MTLCTLALCLAAGILWADAGGEKIFSARPLWTVLGIVATLSIIAWSGRTGFRGSTLSRGLPYLLAGVIAFDAGSTVLVERLREAARDATRAVQSGQQGVRMADAQVVSRRRRTWGDEIELSRARAADGGTPLPVRLLLRVPDDPGSETGADHRAERVLRPGTQVRMALRIQPVHARRNPGSIDRERASARRGLAARARLVDPDWVVLRGDPNGVVSRRVEGISRWRADARRKIGDRLAASGDSSGLARVLSLGDRGALAAGTADDFRALGLSHLLAISGLHVGLVAGLLGWITLNALVWLAPRLIDPFPGVFGTAVLGAGGYAWLVGGSISVRRAWCCLLAVGLLAIARRSPRPIELLSGVAVVLWVQEPSMVFDLGAQLSFAACLGLIVARVWRGPFAERLDDVEVPADVRSTVERVRSALGLSARASCAAGFGTAGVLAAHGLSTALWAPVTNALAVPWMALAALPGSLGAALLGSLLEPGLESSPIRDSWVTHAVRILLWPSQGLADAVVWCAAHLPRSLPAGGGSPLGVGVAALLGLAALRLGWLRATAVCWVLVVLAGGVPRADQGRFAATPRVWFFDVGQGDAALVEGRSASMLIDSGPGAPDGSGGQSLVRSLRALGRSSLDLFVVTHADLDHRGGAIRVLEGLDVGELWLPAAGRGDPPLDRLVKVARARGTHVSWRKAKTTPEYRGDLRIETLWPPEDSIPRSRNAGSLVLRVGVGGRSVLFLADVDAAVELALRREDPQRVRADYLKVSHHGSRGGTREPFLDQVAARHAFVSAPCQRGRGLPHPVTLDRIRRSGTRLWWTGRDGAVAVFPERFGSKDEVVAWARPRVCPTNVP